MTSHEDLYSTVTAYFTVHDAAGAIDFYAAAFGAEELTRIPNEDGSLGHAEIRIGSTVLMLSDEAPDYDAISARTLKGSNVAFVYLTDDVDGSWERALGAGAVEVRPIEDAPYGRGGWVRDPYGIRWSIMKGNPDFDPASMSGG